MILHSSPSGPFGMGSPHRFHPVNRCSRVVAFAIALENGECWSTCDILFCICKSCGSAVPHERFVWLQGPGFTDDVHHCYHLFGSHSYQSSCIASIHPWSARTVYAERQHSSSSKDLDSPIRPTISTPLSTAIPTILPALLLFLATKLSLWKYLEVVGMTSMMAVGVRSLRSGGAGGDGTVTHPAHTHIDKESASV